MTPFGFYNLHSKYCMTKNDIKSAAFAARLRQHPLFRAQRGRFDFDAAIVVETEGTVDFRRARDYALSDQMCGRVRPQSNMFDDTVRWFFEVEEDAILFTLKFGMMLPRRIL